ncbi:FtsX-like permease family protein [Planomonospora corallina]|uniref:FtsX-like permease family protein n=1 Tax=Planomonospora corallina TaxID=1806052 RepID=A0ABV8I956_9ACTN
MSAGRTVRTDPAGERADGTADGAGEHRPAGAARKDARSPLAALLAALRISRRDALRARGRSALIMVMVGLPVLAVTVMLTWYATEDLTLSERLPMELGSADARLEDTREAGPVRQGEDGLHWQPRGQEPPRPPRSQAEVQALAGPGSRVIPMSEDFRSYWRGAAYSEVAVHEVDLRDPMTEGMFPLLSGRYPESADEVVVTGSVEAGIGTTLRYRHTRDDVPKRVVGIVREQPREYGRTVVGLPGGLIPADAEAAARRYWLLDAPAPVGWEETLRLNRAGLAVLSGTVLADPPPAGDGPRDALADFRHVGGAHALLYPVLVVTLLVIEVALLAGPAFAVGLRRRRRELALLAAQGASARHLKLVVLADGLTLGLAGSVLGALLGVGAARVAVSAAGVWPDGGLGPFEVPVGLVALTVGLGVLSAVAAAVVPAVQAGRTSPAAVLAGRPPRPRDRAGWPLLGLLLTAAGTGATAYGRAETEWILGGAVLGLLGLVLLAPLLVKLAGGLAGALPLPLRLAVRDAVRNRGRTAPAVVAVMAAAAAFSTVAVTEASTERSRVERYRPAYPVGTVAVHGDDVTEESWQKIRQIVERALPGVPLVEAYQAVDDAGRIVHFDREDGRCEGCSFSVGPLGELPVGGPALLRFLLGRPDPAAEAALAEGKAVIFNPAAVRDGKARFHIWTQALSGTGEPKEVSLPATTAAVRGPSTVLGVLPLSAPAEAGLEARLHHLVVDPAVTRLTPEQARGIDAPVRAVTPNVAVRLERGVPENRPDTTRFLWIMAAITSVVMLGGTFTAAGLALADARPDLATLSAVGARPRTRRLAAAGQALFIAGLGAPLGLLVGLVPGLALAIRQGEARDRVLEVALNGVPLERAETALAVPWPVLLTVGLGLPLLAALAVAVCTRTTVTLTRRIA